MTRVVVDPSALVSAAITPRNTPPDRVVRAWAAGRFELVVSPLLLVELRAVLSRPKLARYVTADDAAAFIFRLERGGLCIDDLESPPPVTRDPTDDYLVALAQVSGAEVLVSSDRDLLDADLADVLVLNPRRFLERLSSIESQA